MEIRLVTTTGQKYEIFRFRYQIYVEEMGRQQQYCDHQQQIIEEPFDKTGHVFGMFNGNEIVGTVRINYARDSDLGHYETLYAMDEVGDAHPLYTSITTKLMVSKHYRGLAGVKSLCVATYKKALTDGIQHDFIDVNPHLVPFFKRLGYVITKNHLVNHPEYGPVVPMRLDLCSDQKLRASNSPFYSILAKRDQLVIVED